MRPSPMLLVLALLACCALSVWVTVRIQAWFERVRGRRAQLQGKRGELDAERLLLKRGYRIRARQAPASYDVLINGRRTRVALALDFVVERDGRSWVAEVKTGNGASSAHPATRRQLLEYQLATATPSVLLVDPDAGNISEVTFPFMAEPTPLGLKRAMGNLMGGVVLLASLLLVAAAFYLRAR